VAEESLSEEQAGAEKIARLISDFLGESFVFGSWTKGDRELLSAYQDPDTI